MTDTSYWRLLNRAHVTINEAPMYSFLYYVIIPVALAYWLISLLLFRGRGRSFVGITFLVFVFLMSGLFLRFL